MNIKILLRALYSRLLYHLERWKLTSTKYPRRFLQKTIDRPGVWFEVHNIAELNRVRFLDDEEEFIRRLIAAISPEDVFFDIGANIGLVSLHIAKYCREVIAFEPEPGFREHLEINVRLNPVQNIKILPYAIADQNAIIPLFTNGTEGKSPSLQADGFGKRVDVQAVTLSDLVLTHQLPPPSVLKIDIEGAEILAVKGMRDLVAAQPPRLIFLELHPDLLPRFSSSADEVLQLLQMQGYIIQARNQRDRQVHCLLELDRTSRIKGN